MDTHITVHIPVETLKQMIVDEAYDEGGTKAQLLEHLDALIAAVRAENAAEIQRLKETAIMTRYGAR